MKILTSANNEQNMYHDSYFYSVYFDSDIVEFVKHETHSTAGAGYNPTPPDCVKLEEISEEQMAEYKALSSKAAIKLINESSTIFIGDKVQVYKGRKYPKGLEFTVIRRSVYEDQYGRTQTLYLHGEDDVKVSADNCKLLRRAYNDEHISDIVASVSSRYNTDHCLLWHCRH